MAYIAIFAVVVIAIIAILALLRRPADAPAPSGPVAGGASGDHEGTRVSAPSQL